MSLIERILIWCFVALTVFGAGWASRGMHDVKKEVKVLQEDRRETNQNIEHAVQQSEKIDADVHADGVRIDTIRAAVDARLNKPTFKESQHDPVYDQRPGAAQAANPVQTDHGNVDRPVLDAGTVRLLNAARQGAELRAAGGSHEQEPTAAGPPG